MSGKIALIAPVLMLLAGCVVAPVPGPNPNPPVPALRAEVIPKPPVSDDRLTWQPGHWDWTGSGYAWRGGRWVNRPGRDNAWQDGYWARFGAEWVWQPAHWIDPRTG